jgi:hypothetical protein
MAKDKAFEAKYKEERLHRTYIRKEKRKQLRQRKRRQFGEGSGTCPYCGGQMSWCTCCEVWSSNCCIEYGTCQCS